MAFARSRCEFGAIGGQEYRAIRLAGDKAVTHEALDGTVHRCIGDAQASCQVDDACFAGLFDQVTDQFDIIFGHFRLVRFTYAAKVCGPARCIALCVLGIHAVDLASTFPVVGRWLCDGLDR